MSNTDKRLEKHTKEVIIEQIDICLSGQDPRYELGRYVEKLREEIIAQAIAEERERVVEKIRKASIWKLVPDTPRMIMCNDKELDDLLSSLDKLTDKE